MRIDTSQQLRLSQEMRLSPRIIQAMEILQLPMLALRERIDAELVSNPVLELQESDSGQEGETPEDYDSDRGEKDIIIDGGDTSDDFARLDEMTAEYGPDFANSGAPAPARRGRCCRPAPSRSRSPSP